MFRWLIQDKPRFVRKKGGVIGCLVRRVASEGPLIQLFTVSRLNRLSERHIIDCKVT
jgi:hypothetical protein